MAESLTSRSQVFEIKLRKWLGRRTVLGKAFAEVVVGIFNVR